MGLLSTDQVQGKKNGVGKAIVGLGKAIGKGIAKGIGKAAKKEVKTFIILLVFTESYSKTLAVNS